LLNPNFKIQNRLKSLFKGSCEDHYFNRNDLLTSMAMPTEFFEGLENTLTYVDKNSVKTMLFLGAGASAQSTA